MVPFFHLYEIANFKHNNILVYSGSLTEDIICYNSKLHEIFLPDFSMWFKEKVRFADCGDEAAKWFSQALTGKDNQMRLGYYNQNIPDRTVEDWKPYTDVYKKLRTEYLVR